MLKPILGRAFLRVYHHVSHFCFDHSCLVNDWVLNNQLHSSNSLFNWHFKNEENQTQPHYLLQSVCLLDVHVSPMATSILSWRTSLWLLSWLAALGLYWSLTSGQVLLIHPSNQFLFLFPPLHLYCQHPTLGPHNLCCEWSDRCFALLKIQWKIRKGAWKGRQTGPVVGGGGRNRESARRQTQKSDREPVSQNDIHFWWQVM